VPRARDAAKLPRKRRTASISGTIGLKNNSAKGQAHDHEALIALSHH
jgi:hypothetical protein